jgi:hypothetical protein
LQFIFNLTLKLSCRGITNLRSGICHENIIRVEKVTVIKERFGLRNYLVVEAASIASFGVLFKEIYIFEKYLNTCILACLLFIQGFVVEILEGKWTFSSEGS